ncbi:helix-turn-helix domain-containing protein [Dysosmobacter sp.]|uniref:helix-turn-helix domain-containing protein n=1 Tax=Dysosmobacter sp. TaxID=2591382 RepID=UPI003AB14DCC
MRKTKPPVGWEHVKNCFPVPNILLDMDLPASAVAVYLYLLRSADRKTDQCHPSEATIAKRLHLSRNTVAKYVRLLEERGLIITEHTKIITKNGIKKNGSLLYTIIPLQKVMEQHYEQQFNALERTTERQKVQAKLAEQLGA